MGFFLRFLQFLATKSNSENKNESNNLVHVYLDRKALLSLSPTASLAFMLPLTYPTPSVFHADQRGMINIWIRTLWPEFWSNPRPHGGPQHQQGQRLILVH